MSPAKPAKRARQEPKPEGSSKRGAKDPKRSLEAIQQCCVCPITQALLVDPVVAADGNSYERDAIQKWLAGHNTSPVSNQPLSAKTVYSSVTLRQSVTELVESGAVQGEAAAQWHLASGKCKHTGALPGGEAAARTHFEAAAELGSEAAALIIKLLDPLTAAREAKLDVSWLVGGGTPAGGQWVPLTGYIEMAEGTIVKVIADVEELERLCERSAPGAEDAVTWSYDMADFAGNEATLDLMQTDSDFCTETKSYCLVPVGRDDLEERFFPWDAILIRAS